MSNMPHYPSGSSSSNLPSWRNRASWRPNASNTPNYSHHHHHHHGQHVPHPHEFSSNPSNSAAGRSYGRYGGMAGYQGPPPPSSAGPMHPHHHHAPPPPIHHIDDLSGRFGNMNMNPDEQFRRPRASHGPGGYNYPSHYPSHAPSYGPHHQQPYYNQPSYNTAPTTRDPTAALGLTITLFPSWLKVRHLCEVFGEFGEIAQASIHFVYTNPNKPSSSSSVSNAPVSSAAATTPASESSTGSFTRTYAFVQYVNPGSAAKAVQTLSTRHVFKMDGPLKMSFWFGDQQSSMSAGPAMGGMSGAPTGPSSAPSNVTGDVLENLEESDPQTIRIADLPLNIESQRAELESFLTTFGNLRRCDIIPKPSEWRAIAYVSFSTAEATNNALEALAKPTPISQTPLTASLARLPSRRSSATPKPPSPMVPRSIYIENIPPSLDPAEFISALAVHGDLQSASIIPRKGTNPFGLVIYYDAESADRAMTHLSRERVWGMREPLLCKRPDYTSIYIRNLPIHIPQTAVREFFGPCGAIRDIRILSIKEGKDTTIAFVDFETPEGATRGLVAAHEAREPWGVRLPGGLRVEFTVTEGPRKDGPHPSMHPQFSSHPSAPVGGMASGYEAWGKIVQ